MNFFRKPHLWGHRCFAVPPLLHLYTALRKKDIQAVASAWDVCALCGKEFTPGKLPPLLWGSNVCSPTQGSGGPGTAASFAREPVLSQALARGCCGQAQGSPCPREPAGWLRRCEQGETSVSMRIYNNIYIYNIIYNIIMRSGLSTCDCRQLSVGNFSPLLLPVSDFSNPSQ